MTVGTAVGKAIDSCIEKGSRALKRVKQNHLCGTCKRYLKGFCGLGHEITDGTYYQEILMSHILEKYDRTPDVTIHIGSCKDYSKRFGRVEVPGVIDEPYLKDRA